MKTGQNPSGVQQGGRACTINSKVVDTLQNRLSRGDIHLLENLYTAELLYERNYLKDSLQGSSIFLDLVRTFQPELLSGGKFEIAVVRLIEKQVTDDYRDEIEAQKGYNLLKRILNKDLFISIKGLHSIAIEENIFHLKKIDKAIMQHVQSVLKHADLNNCIIEK